MGYNAGEDAPYDNTVPDREPETLPLEEVLLQLLAENDRRLNVALPAQVVAVSGDQQVDVQPLLQSRDTTSATPYSLPVLKDVPVIMPQGANYAIHLPVAVGDNGLAVFCDRSLDAWVASDGSGPVDPQDTRAHHLSDPVWLPGMVPFGKQTTDGTTDLVLRSGGAQLRLLQNGKIVLGGTGAGGQELFTLLDQLMQAVEGLVTTLSSAMVNVSSPGTPAPFMTNVISALAQSSATLQQIQTNIDMLKK